MENLSKTVAADAAKDPKPPTSGVTCDNVSLPSYKDYPVHSPFINTQLSHTPQTHTQQSWRAPSPSKAFPESSSAAILSALRNLQEKIRRLELEKGQADVMSSLTHLQSDKVAQKLLSNQVEKVRDKSDPTNCNHVLITHLAAAESRCMKLERQLDHMRKMLRNSKADRSNLVKQQISMDATKVADRQLDTVSEHVHLEKLERLEQDYLRLTRTQRNAEMKIHQLEMKLHEEEHQRKLIQDKAIQLQTGLEANRILLQSVSPCLSTRQSKEKKLNSQKPFPQPSLYSEPHYHLSLRDVPFVAGTSVGCSHSVRANVQSVLSLLKQHQPHLCNSRVLSDNVNGHYDSSSSSSSANGEELSELLHALHEELRLMSVEHEELIRQVKNSVSELERRELQREQESLLLKMERKGDQISKLYKHRTQIKKLRKDANSRWKSRNDVSTRGRSAAPVKLRPVPLSTELTIHTLLFCNGAVHTRYPLCGCINC
uniref:Centrosomal protein 57 n=1 Tax=Cynoglossus semilaevis TaxID=244447 RepID=A0A3P8WHZ9_CYNSE